MPAFKQYLLLVQDQSHVDALPACAAGLKARGYGGIWLLFSPVVLVDTKTAAADFDKQIAELTAAKDRCKAADDFDGAKGYKSQIDDLVLRRTAKVKDAWKALTEAEQEKAFERVFGDFFAAKPAPNIRPERMREHYEPGNFIDAQNAHRKAWFAPFTPGNFEFGWPTCFVEEARAIVTVPAEAKEAPKMIKAAAKMPPIPAPASPAPKPGGNPMFSDPTYRLLLSMGLPQLEQRASELNIKISGSIGKIRSTIWKHEKERAASTPAAA